MAGRIVLGQKVKANVPRLMLSAVIAKSVWRELDGSPARPKFIFVLRVYLSLRNIKPRSGRVFVYQALNDRTGFTLLCLQRKKTNRRL